jgi:tetratricopeptide (TPR) repeat protein
MANGATLFRVLIVVTLGVGATRVVNAQEELPRPINQPGGAPGGAISGRVVLPSGHPVTSSVRVILSSPEDPGLPTYTDNNGNFTFNNLREGAYTVEVYGDRKLYEPVFETVRVIRSRVMLTIYLKEKVGTSASAGNVVSAAEVDQKVPSQAKKEYDRAIRSLNVGKTHEAIDGLRRALALYPNYLMARNDLGVQYLKLNRLPEALEQFESAIEINTKAFNPRLNLGIVLVRQKRFTEALDHLRIADSIDSSSPSVHLYLGIALLETDESPSAERELGRALSLGGREYEIAHYYLGLVFMKNGDRERAIRELKSYIENSPDGEESARARQLLQRLSQG